MRIGLKREDCTRPICTNKRRADSMQASKDERIAGGLENRTLAATAFLEANSALVRAMRVSLTLR